jgi:hypothetical protein
VIKLHHFQQSEFQRDGRNWYELMDPYLLVLLDVFRHQWGSRVVISGHPQALGRDVDLKVTSDHNVNRHGRVMAADVLPSGMDTKKAASRALDLARRCGFTAIGIYPHWVPAPGLHLGVRHERAMADPALWGAVSIHGKQTYCALDQALDAMP